MRASISPLFDPAKTQTPTTSQETTGVLGARRGFSAPSDGAASQGVAPQHRLSGISLAPTSAPVSSAQPSSMVQPVQRTGGQIGEPSKPAAAAKGGLSAELKTGIESLSGVSMEGVRVHYNSPKPAQLRAEAYAQGRDIHVAPGREQHVPHEAWHLAQQAQGRVQATMQAKGLPINDSDELEKEADVMGAKALKIGRAKVAEAARSEEGPSGEGHHESVPAVKSVAPAMPAPPSAPAK